MFSILDGREEFFQWDIDQKLIVNDAAITEVHFCNKTDSCALVCEVYTENVQRLVDVPNILLQQDWSIKAYAYCTNHTIVEKRFKVRTRSKPADYVYTETEVKTWDQMQKNTNNNFANALKGEKSGEIVALADVAPIEHDLKVSVSGVDDLTSVNVKQYGLNLFDGELRACIYDQNKTPEYNFESFESNPIKADVFQSLKVYLPAGTYTINSSVAINLVRRIINNDGRMAYSKINTKQDTFTLNYAQFVGFTFRRNDEAAWNYDEHIWITAGTYPTNYEPYKEPNTYTVDEHGAVSGIVGTGDSMTLTTDTSGAVLDVKYNRDLNKAFAELQTALVSMVSMGGDL